MTEKKVPSIDELKRVMQEAQKEEPPNPTLREAVIAIAEDIEILLARRWTCRQIVERLASTGLQIKVGTLQLYMRQWQAEKEQAGGQGAADQDPLPKDGDVPSGSSRVSALVDEADEEQQAAAHVDLPEGAQGIDPPEEIEH